MIVVKISGSSCRVKKVIPVLLSALAQTQNNRPLFVRQAEHLDIDTPQKDSYELFEAGLDFAMLVTDKQRYLKSRHEVSRYLPIPSDADWLIQDGEIYPSDIRLTLTENDTILTECGLAFSLESLTALMDWLEQHESK